MENIITGIALGFISGAIVAGSGYLKNKPKYDFEGFNSILAVKTVVIGGLAGAAIGATGMQQEAVVTLFETMGVAVIVENALKSIKARFF